MKFKEIYKILTKLLRSMRELFISMDMTCPLCGGRMKRCGSISPRKIGGGRRERIPMYRCSQCGYRRLRDTPTKTEV